MRLKSLFEHRHAHPIVLALPQVHAGHPVAASHAVDHRPFLRRGADPVAQVGHRGDVRAVCAEAVDLLSDDEARDGVGELVLPVPGVVVVPVAGDRKVRRRELLDVLIARPALAAVVGDLQEEAVELVLPVQEGDVGPVRVPEVRPALVVGGVWERSGASFGPGRPTIGRRPSSWSWSLPSRWNGGRRACGV